MVMPELSRRGLLAGLGGAALAAGLPRLSLGAADTDRRLVVVILRGALDGLAAVPPHGDPAYRSARGGLALAAPGSADGIVDLDGFFGLNPALAPLADLWRKGELLPVQAVATPYRERSHFDGQDLLENGTATPHGSSSGWLNRAVALLPGARRSTALAVGQAVPLLLRGSAPVASWAPSRLPALDGAFLERVAELYRGDPPFAQALAEAEQAQELARSALGADAMAPQGASRAALIRVVAGDAGRLLAAADGPRVAVLEAYGWDTHVGQGTDRGRLAVALGDLAGGLTALAEGSGPAWRDTVVLVVTEFGRTVAMNGTGGSDHGTASVALLLGGAVAGGRVAGRWPGLAPDRLYQGRDLAPTSDLRAVAKAVLIRHLGLPPAAVESAIFPDSAGVTAMPGLLRV
jgi:uncharacterized protein (DUF1501 family)